MLYHYKQMGFFDDKKYLMFEGGGGKGFAYMGALKAFQNTGLNYSTYNSEHQV